MISTPSRTAWRRVFRSTTPPEARSSKGKPPSRTGTPHGQSLVPTPSPAPRWSPPRRTPPSSKACMRERILAPSVLYPRPVARCRCRGLTSSGLTLTVRSSVGAPTTTCLRSWCNLATAGAPRRRLDGRPAAPARGCPPQWSGWAAAKRSRSMNFWILPDAVCGKESTNSQWRGALYDARCARQ